MTAAHAEPPQLVERNPDRVLAVLLRDRPVHPYGIADVVQLWDRARWWEDGDAAVALLDLPGASTPVLYAVAARGAGAATLDLVRRLAAVLPDRFECTAPVGFTGALQPAYRPEWVDRYQKMHLARPERVPPADPQTVGLGHRDLPALQRLFGLDPHAGDFFHPGLLDTGMYVGRWVDGGLVAAAGVHVVEQRHRVAAIGNVVTHPDHRRQGHARRMVAAVCRRLLADGIDVIGLNVRTSNRPAVALYGDLGFDALVPFEEGVFARVR